ncbi:MAG: hypothetical protein J6J87_05195 [Oscillospiraceae bacterium]|nr:hypothetical protein [Oscillospiraceae bacterium]
MNELSVLAGSERCGACFDDVSRETLDFYFSKKSPSPIENPKKSGYNRTCIILQRKKDGPWQRESPL